MTSGLTAELRIEALEARVTELQADCTRVENERRKYKALHEHTRALLQELLVDSTIVMRLAGPARFEASAHEAMMLHLGAVRGVHERNELLEVDAWCGAANLARDFVREANVVLEAKGVDGGAAFETLIEKYRDLFHTITR